MKIEDLKVGDVILWKLNSDADEIVTQTVKYISEKQLLVENEDNCKSLEVIWADELGDYSLKPKTRKLYAYATNLGGGMIKFYTDCDDSDLARAPEFDIEYKE